MLVLVLSLALFPGLQCGLAIGCMGVRIETAKDATLRLSCESQGTVLGIGRRLFAQLTTLFLAIVCEIPLPVILLVRVCVGVTV